MTAGAPPPAAPPNNPPSDNPPSTDGVDRQRLASFSDNVISIAATLLVLDVRVPADATAGHATVLGILTALRPRLLAFVLSFAIVGVYWVGHHLMVRGLREISRAGLWANNLFLCTISLIPASAALLGGNPAQPAAEFLYGANLLLVGLALFLFWSLGVRYHRASGFPMAAADARLGYTRTLIGCTVAVVGMAASFARPHVSYAVYCVTPAAFILIQMKPRGV